MSTKICVDPAKPHWTDAVTLGVLTQMIDALYGLGYDVDTPVTYLHDRDHVWLETIDDGEWEIAVDVDSVPEPRVWELVEEIPEGVVVRDCYGAMWKWEKGRRYLRTPSEDDWDEGVSAPRNELDVAAWGPFTEVLA